MLSGAKIACYSAQVRDCKGDMKKLYKLVNTLTGMTSSNPLPNDTNDKLLDNEFADFFMNKIQKIRDNLTKNPVYQLTGKSIPSLTEFRSFTQTEVREIIFSMKTKSCKLDALPTKLLKECIDSILPTITSLVNISLSNGVFAFRWKIAIIRPLLKKSTLDLISSSYHPVSNLSFLSKLLVKMCHGPCQ